MQRVVWGTVAAISGVMMVTVGYLAVNFNLAGDCVDEISKQYLSPDKTNTALVIVQNCGATSDYSTSVVIRHVGERVRLGDDYVFSVKGLNNIEVVWTGNYDYSITYDRPEKVNRQAIIWQGHKIPYHER